MTNSTEFDSYSDLTGQIGRQVKSIGIAGGIITLILGILVMAFTSDSLNVLMVLIGISAIVGGIFRLVASVTGATDHPWLLGIASLILIAGGIILIRNPEVSTEIFGLIIGAIWLITGIAQFFAALFSSAFAHRGWMLVGGAISGLAGIVVLAQPDVSVQVLAWITGLYLVVTGIVILIESFMVRY